MKLKRTFNKLHNVAQVKCKQICVADEVWDLHGLIRLSYEQALCFVILRCVCFAAV